MMVTRAAHIVTLRRFTTRSPDLGVTTGDAARSTERHDPSVPRR